MPKPEDKEKEKKQKALFDDDGFDPGNAPDDPPGEGTIPDVPEDFKDPQKAYLKAKEAEDRAKKAEETLKEKDKEFGVARDYLFKVEAEKERLRAEAEAARAAGGNGSARPEVIDEAGFNKAIYENPYKALDQFFQHKMKPLEQRYVNDASQLATLEVKQNPEFPKYKEKFEYFWAQTRPENRTPQAANLIYRFLEAEDLKAREAEIIKKEKELEEKGRRGQPAEPPPSYAKPGASADEDVQPLTPEEIKVARAFGMDEKTWRNRAKVSRVSVID